MILQKNIEVPWVENLSKDKVLENIETRNKRILSIRKRLLSCLGPIMMKESLQNLIVTRQIKGKKDRGKPHIT